jgi:hypothetical protein
MVKPVGHPQPPTSEELSEALVLSRLLDHLSPRFAEHRLQLRIVILLLIHVFSRSRHRVLSRR